MARLWAIILPQNTRTSEGRSVCIIYCTNATHNASFPSPTPFPSHLPIFHSPPSPPPCLFLNSACKNNGIIIQIMLKDKDSKQSIQVTIRVRPLSQKQINEDSRICVRLQQNNSLYLNAGSEVKKFTFDSICFNESQQQIFNRVGRKCTIDCLEGYNCTIFAYGQTGAGKTYTMMGVNFENENYFEHRGLIPRTMEFLFECIDRQRENGVNFVIRCSFLEIYNEQIIDLLNKANNNLQLREDTRKGVYVEGITEEIINRGEEAMEILYKGSKSRHVGSTFYNETSSRSHSVFTMQIESKYTKNGVSNTKSRQFNFIDLAGSERTKQSTGERLKEGCNINKSLMNLASVINALSEVSEGKTQHVNYRNSKLTFLLKDSLGGNSKTNLIANISPATVFCQQTISTLGFARRAKLIKRDKASINEDSTGNLESMKNQIKRLKQEVITLMSRCQTTGDNPSISQQQKPSQMTAIMHQYVEQQIDKQTRLELEILKLNDRIVQLQNGIKQYSNNEIHLRMIINIYEDKVNRLKGIQRLLNENIDNLDDNDEQSKIIVNYFRSERNSFLKQLENLRNQADNNKFLKELLKEAKVMKDDGEDESLKDLLVKNTTFLNIIRTKLDQMKPENIESGVHSEYQKKITMMEEQYSKRNEEYQERYEQINLELADFKNRNEENEKLLEDAISGQISLEEKVKEEQEINKKIQRELEENQNLLKQSSNEKQSQKSKSQEIINELRCDISDRDSKMASLRKQVDTLKSKLEKAYANETALKEEFQILEQEKYKVDKILMQNIEELRESKNTLVKSESEIALLQRKIQALSAEKQDLQESQTKLHESILEKDKNFKTKLQEIERNHAMMLKQKEEQSNSLSALIKSHEEAIKGLNERLSNQTEELEAMISQYSKMDQEHKSLVANKDEKLRELTLLINEKELNGNETNVQLNQLKLELINAHSQKESIEGKYKKTVEELREKLNKQHLNYESLQGQMSERVKMYDNLNHQYQLKKKECSDLNDSLTKIRSKVKVLEQEIVGEQQKLEELSKELDSFRNREKQYKLSLIEMKNELFVSQKNSQIELDALRSQITLKDQQIQQLEKEQSKSKHRLEKQIEQLSKQLQNTQQSNKVQEESLKKSMESHLTSKEKKLSEMRQTLSDREEKIKQLEKQYLESSEQVKIMTQVQSSFSEKLNTLERQRSELLEAHEGLKMELNELKVNHQKELQENEEIHNEQIDQKNEQIQSFMLENQSLNTQITELKKEVEDTNKLNQSLLHEISVKNDNYKEITEQTTQSQGEILRLSKEFQAYKQAKQQQIVQITEQSTERVNEISKEHEELQQKMIELNGNYEQEQEVNEEMLKKLQTYYEELKTVKQESSNYISTISLLTQQNCSLNQELKKQFDSQKAKEEQYASLEQRYQEERLQLQTQINRLSSVNKNLSNQLLQMNALDNQNKQKLIELHSLSDQLTKSLQKERQEVSSLFATNKSLDQRIVELQAKIKDSETLLHQTQEKLQQEIKILNNQFEESINQCKKASDCIEKIESERNNIKVEHSKVVSDLSKATEEIKALTALLKDTKDKQGKEINKLSVQNTFLSEENKQLGTEIINSAKHTRELNAELEDCKEKMAKYEVNLHQMQSDNERLAPYRHKCEQQAIDLERMKHSIEEERASKERIFHELSKEKENSSNLKLLIDNKSAQNQQLEIQLEQKDSIYKKLVQKIAKFQGENKKASTSQHYLKTIELLEKSRAEQIQLRRQNEELKKVMMTMKETIEQKENQFRQMNQQSESYCSSMHKRLEEIQNDYVELQRNHQKLVKERKLYSHDNEQLKEEIKNLKLSVVKITQKNEQMQGKIKKASLDYIQLQKEYEEIKRNQSILPNNNDEKTIYINRLKAEVAALKTEKVLLTQTLNKEREEKTKLKAEMRYGKDGNTELTTKLQYDKKLNENKNLTELIFQIISQLKICVNEPKAKLEVIRSIILGAIKEKNTEIKTLKDKVKELQNQQYRQVPSKSDYSIHRDTRELKALSISNANRNLPTEQPLYKFQKEKDPSFLNNNSRQKMKEFQKYYAKFKYDGDSKAKNI